MDGRLRGWLKFSANLSFMSVSLMSVAPFPDSKETDLTELKNCFEFLDSAKPSISSAFPTHHWSCIILNSFWAKAYHSMNIFISLPFKPILVFTTLGDKGCLCCFCCHFSELLPLLLWVSSSGSTHCFLWNLTTTHFKQSLLRYFKY